jgi:hypothetical protein
LVTKNYQGNRKSLIEFSYVFTSINSFNFDLQNKEELKTFIHRRNKIGFISKAENSRKFVYEGN